MRKRCAAAGIRAEHRALKYKIQAGDGQNEKRTFRRGSGA